MPSETAFYFKEFLIVLGVAGLAVPETIESSLQLGEALLVETGVPMGLAIASVHERRDGFRKLLGRPNRKEELELAKKRLRREKSAGQDPAEDNSQIVEHALS